MVFVNVCKHKDVRDSIGCDFKINREESRKVFSITGKDSGFLFELNALCIKGLINIG